MKATCATALLAILLVASLREAVAERRLLVSPRIIAAVSSPPTILPV